MKQNPFRAIGKILFSVAVVVCVGLFILLAVKSLPTSQVTNAAYPGLIDTQVTSSSLSAEALCDRWFSYRKGLPEDKRAIADEEYKNCVYARTTPSPIGAMKPIPSEPTVGKYSSSFFSRTAGNGTILESSFSPLNSIYRISNQWVADINSNHITIYSGGRQSDSASGDALLNDLSWPGVLVVTVTDIKGNYLPDKGGMFWTPLNAGPVRIVDASGTMLTLVAKNGTSFVFDVVNRRFISTETSSSISRSIGAGTLVENSKTPYPIASFEFVNYWYYGNKDLGRIAVLAGKEKGNPRTGVLIVVVSLFSDPSVVVQETVYKTVLSDGSLRIVDADGEKITLVSENDLVYEFNVALQQFVSLPAGSEAISALPIKVTESSISGSGLFAGTPTPTSTLSPQPTRTPLPTRNPYP